DPELQGSTWHFDSVTIQRGAVQPSAPFAELRRNTLALLFGLYREAQTPDERRELIQTMSEATRSSMNAIPGGALVELVLDDTRAIVSFFSERVESEPFEIVQHLEHQFLWLHRHTKEMGSPQADSAVPAKAGAVVTAIEGFRDRANSNAQFVRF